MTGCWIWTFYMSPWNSCVICRLKSIWNVRVIFILYSAATTICRLMRYQPFNSFKSVISVPISTLNNVLYQKSPNLSTASARGHYSRETTLDGRPYYQDATWTTSQSRHVMDPRGSGRRWGHPTKTWRSTFKEDLVDRRVDWNNVRAVATNRPLSCQGQRI